MVFPTYSSNELQPFLPDLGNFDFALKKASLDSQSKSMLYDFFKKNAKFFNYVFTATIASGSIICTQFDGNANFSMVVTLNEQDCGFLEQLNVIVGSYIPNVEEWTATTIVKEDAKAFLKLKYDSKKSLNLKATSNIPINLKKPLDTKIFQGQEVVVTGQLGFYMNFQSKTYGAAFTPTGFQFGE